MMRTINIGSFAALLVVLALTVVLVTPDPTDDIPGILHSQKLVKMVKSLPFLSVAIILPDSASCEQQYLDFQASSNPQGLVQMICSYRC